MKKRLLFYQLKRHLSHKNAQIITGMRQVGKTTLMRQLYGELPNTPKLWFDFDNPLDQKLFESADYIGIYKKLQTLAGPKPKRLTVFIDEVQNLPEITKIIKYFMDHFGVKFILTGSSSFYLKNLFPESLSGRKFLYTLTPLRFQEFLYFKGLVPLSTALKPDLEKNIQSGSEWEFQRRVIFYQEFMKFGGFPEVVTTPDAATKQMILKNIFASFFEKDLRLLSDYKDIRELRDLLLLLVPRVGSMLDITKLAGELGVKRVKIYSYLEFLQGTFFIYLLPKFSRSIDRAVAGGKKIYFSDTGILNTIGAVNDAQLLENAAVNQLTAYGGLSYYNQRNTAEIDAIVNKKMALEIKLSASENDYRKLAKLAVKLGLPYFRVVSLKYNGNSQFTSPVFI